MTLDVHGLMENLSDERPIFHSEADFQHALAWQFRKATPNGQVRLEYKPFPEANLKMYLDIWLRYRSMGVAIELKYRTRALDRQWKKESFALRNQGAQDLGRYDFLRDIQRLERVVADFGPAKTGFAVLLTNDPSFWNPPSRSTIDAAFRLHESENKRIAGDMAWSAQASEGTTTGREEPICLKGSYDCVWRDYSSFGEATNQRFRYLMVEVR